MSKKTGLVFYLCVFRHCTSQGDVSIVQVNTIQLPPFRQLDAGILYKPWRGELEVARRKLASGFAPRMTSFLSPILFKDVDRKNSSVP